MTRNSAPPTRERASAEPDPAAGRPHTFAFSRDGEHFLLDGAPLQIRSGELHPARIPHAYWRHRIQMAKAMGLNTVALYVMWNYHEMGTGPTQAQHFDFSSDDRAIGTFIDICQQEGMWVLLRPGPYVCAEWDLGGLSASLLSLPDIRLRTDSATDPRYMAAVRRYIDALIPLVKPRLASHGGPILMIQIENEFGSYASNPAYLEEIRSLWLRGGVMGPFYTEDGLAQLQRNHSNVSGGAIALSNGDAAQIAAARRAFPDVPVMAGEVYPGWLTHWGDAAMQGTSVDISTTLDEFMRLRLSFNLYVLHGGTSFGFFAGANIDENTLAWQPDITSYDYAAPVDEQGAATPKYHAYRDIIARHLTAPLPAVPAPPPLLDHADEAWPAPFASLWDNLPSTLVRTLDPLPFEMFGQGYGFVLYRTTLHDYRGGTLRITDVHDYATVFIDGRYIGALSRAVVAPRYAQPLKVSLDATLALPIDPSQRSADAVLEILVEGMGRVNYGHAMIDRKGITESVALDARVLTRWETVPLPMDAASLDAVRPVCTQAQRPGLFFRSTVRLDVTGDTWLDMSAWTKGLVWMNGRHLGRYWQIGPQQRLFCPGVWLMSGENVLTIFDLHATDARPVAFARSAR